jgi:hypothetical protein
MWISRTVGWLKLRALISAAWVAVSAPLKFGPQILDALGIADESIPVAVMDHRTVGHGWSQPDLPISEQKGRPWPRGAPSASAP